MMPRMTWSGTLDALSNLSGGWKMLGAVLAVAAVTISFGGKVNDLLSVSSKLEQHMAQVDTTNYLLRENLKEEKLHSCLQVAQLRRADWTLCLLTPARDGTTVHP